MSAQGTDAVLAQCEIIIVLELKGLRPESRQGPAQHSTTYYWHFFILPKRLSGQFRAVTTSQSSLAFSKVACSGEP